jgi:hypothetical protein
MTAAAVALPGRGAAAQRSGATPFRHTLEAYVAQYSLDRRLGTNKRDLDGFGLRLTFQRPEAERTGRTVADRATGALFATYTPSQGDPKVSTLHAGAQTDVSILPRPVAGLLDPFASFALGVFYTSRANLVGTGGGRIRRTDLALTPGIGTRLRFLEGIGARGDLRMPLVFGLATTANVVAEAGLYVSF